MGLFTWLFGRTPRQADAPNELLRMAMTARQPIPKTVLPPTLKPYVTRLRKVHGTTGSFASPETREIGEEIYEQLGHDAMVEVCDVIRSQLGGGAARDLEYKWGGIGEWQG